MVRRIRFSGFIDLNLYGSATSIKGHVTPLMEAARRLTSSGLKVTFVNTEFTHKLVSACSKIHGLSDLMQLVSIPYGMEPCDDRSDLGKLTKAMFQLMPIKLE
ncbi:hypothetical protein R6Q59_020139 [Mikania micrantha]|uniref:Uncharacterized protein n=1 Tax=Mikania micrantha TaxID=192012 RepID=A0A5N6PSC7_9ASTR|nr:hypothetical protein E3N88_06876 [Mikania micrantha]